MISERDQRAIDFVRQFGAANTSQILQIYFRGDKKPPPNQALLIMRKRLKKLVDDKVLKRKRYHLNMEYIYYTKWTNQIHHKIIIADFYLKLLSMGGEIIRFGNEEQLDGLRPDAVVEYKINKQTHWFFLEVQLNNSFNQQKYEDYYNSRKYTSIFSINGHSTFPKVVIVANKKFLLHTSRITYIMLPIDLEEMERVFQ